MQKKLLAQCQFLVGAKEIGPLGTVSKIEYSKGWKWLDSLPNNATSPYPKQTNKQTKKQVQMKLLAHCQFLVGAKEIGPLGTVSLETFSFYHFLFFCKVNILGQ